MDFGFRILFLMPNDPITFLIYFTIGVLPCILWLLFYLRQDVHPESNKKVIEVFLWGALMVGPVIIFEGFFGIFFPEEDALIKNIPLLFVYYIFVIGLIEELSKYLTVKIRVFNDSHFDEPVDAMLYLIIAGLGFAAVENIVMILKESINGAIMISALRLFSAVFLHTLAAAITGYFFAYSFYQRAGKRKRIQITGVMLAAFFHGIYNVSVTKLDPDQILFSFFLPVGIIILMAILVRFFFSKVKKLPRGCRI